MADCSKAEVLFGEFYRMCERNESCCKCEMYKPAGNEACIKWISKNTKEAIEIVQKWSDEHPIKTRQNEFLKMFPNVVRDDKTIQIIPCVVEQGYKPPKGCKNISCRVCREEYWLAEVE